MSTTLDGDATVYEFMQNLTRKIARQIDELSDEQILASSAAELAEYYLQHNWPDPIEQDNSRPVEASPISRFVQKQHHVFDTVVRAEIRTTRLEIPVVPHHLNSTALRLRGESNWPTLTIIDRACAFDEHDQLIFVNVSEGKEKEALSVVKQRISQINNDLRKYDPIVKERINHYAATRKNTVEQRSSDFTNRMRSLGITLKRTDADVRPTKVSVKTPVSILRNKLKNSKRLEQPVIDPESLKEIIGLVNTVGRNFEVSPKAYAELSEERLRDIIVGSLNSVFQVPRATGETFSRSGKTDITLHANDGVIVVAECKFWSGAARYRAALEQLSRYLTWRQTVGILLTFCKIRGLSNVVEKAIEAVGAHMSTVSEPRRVGESYFVSRHRHISDDEKLVDVHHLLFDLWSG